MTTTTTLSLLPFLLLLSSVKVSYSINIAEVNCNQSLRRRQVKIIIIMWLPTACPSAKHLTFCMDTVSYRSASMWHLLLHFPPTIINQSIAAAAMILQLLIERTNEVQLLLSNNTCTCFIWLLIPFWIVGILNGMSDVTAGYYKIQFLKI